MSVKFQQTINGRVCPVHRYSVLTTDDSPASQATILQESWESESAYTNKLTPFASNTMTRDLPPLDVSGEIGRRDFLKRSIYAQIKGELASQNIPFEDI